MVTVKRLCDYLEREVVFRELIHKGVNASQYAMCKQFELDEEKLKYLLHKNYESDKLYILRQCMTLIALSMIERGEY